MNTRISNPANVWMKDYDTLQISTGQTLLLSYIQAHTPVTDYLDVCVSYEKYTQSLTNYILEDEKLLTATAGPRNFPS